MTSKTTLTVRVSGALRDFVAENVGSDGSYENVSEYVRALIRQDKTRSEEERVARLRAELQLAFSAPDEAFHPLSAHEVIRRAGAREELSDPIPG